MRGLKQVTSVCARGLVRREPQILAAVNSQFCFAVRSQSTTASPYKHGKHRSNAQVLVNQVPVIEVEGHIAVCDGGSGALGHPVEYIQLDTVSGKPQICKYCGLRFISKHHHH